MKSPIFLLALGTLAAGAAGGVAWDRCQAAKEAREEREGAQEDLRKAAALAERFPRAFGPDAPASGGDSSMKTLAQEAAAGRSVLLGYLSESEREAEKGRRERQVLLRLTNAPHPNLVLFLQDLEARGGGAKIKELHVRPSRELPDAYEEVEVVLSKTVTPPVERKP